MIRFYSSTNVNVLAMCRGRANCATYFHNCTNCDAETVFAEYAWLFWEIRAPLQVFPRVAVSILKTIHLPVIKSEPA